MVTSAQPPAIPRAILDIALRRAPCDVLVCDTSLTVRYAAPCGAEFFGRQPEEIVGRPLHEVFPPSANGLGQAIERAVRAAEPWNADAYRFPDPPSENEPSFCWSVVVEPIAAGRFRGVLIALSDVADLTRSNEQLRSENQHLQAAVDALRQRLVTDRGLVMTLRENIRTSLTPVMGYLQVIVRWPQRLGSQSVEQVVERRVLPPLTAIVDLVDRAAEGVARNQQSESNDSPRS